MMRFVEDVWYGRGGGLAPLRAVLAPLGHAYGAAMAVRRRLYDEGVLGSAAVPVPVVSVGNLTVGGTGKTPFAAWLVARLRERSRPALVMRGYGADEVVVHSRLNPGVPVIADADRVAAAREAVRIGADVIVLDDGFQHRRLRRTADVVLLSVEQLARPRRVLPAGPWREPPATARRATLVVFTRKSASAGDAARAMQDAGAVAGDVPVTLIHLAPDTLEAVSGGVARPLADVNGRDVLAVTAIGEPEAFRAQLALAGARVRLAAYPDHHDFTAADVALLARQAPPDGLVVCTLKDAVKLAALWPASSPLWYVSQRLVVEHGAEHLTHLVERVLAARTGTTITAG